MDALVVSLQWSHGERVFALGGDAIGGSQGCSNRGEQRQASATRRPSDVATIGVGAPTARGIDDHHKLLLFDELDRIGQ